MEVAFDTAECVARRSYGKLVAFLAARTRDVAAAEDAIADAFAAALEDWPQNGCPANPEAWLLTVARRRWLNAARNDKRRQALAAQVPPLQTADAEIPDERLGLMFACAHPAIDPAIRAPLILQSVLGLDAARIARAFLTSPSAMSQRLVRAKTKIRNAGIPLRIPERGELSGRLEAVLDAIYAAFTSGWIDAAGADAACRELSNEAVFLGRVVAELLPGEAEALGLLALMLYADARKSARRDERGDYVPLEVQDVALWDAGMIEEAEALLRRASVFNAPGRYQLEAALQSAHVERRCTGRPNWTAVLQLYDALLALSGSPVVAINRAVAVAEVYGAGVALQGLSDAASDARLEQYQPYWAARAELLAKTGAIEESRQAYDVAIGLEPDAAVRKFLRKRQCALE